MSLLSLHFLIYQSIAAFQSSTWVKKFFFVSSSKFKYMTVFFDSIIKSILSVPSKIESKMFWNSRTGPNNFLKTVDANSSLSWWRQRCKINLRFKLNSSFILSSNKAATPFGPTLTFGVSQFKKVTLLSICQNLICSINRLTISIAVEQSHLSIDNNCSKSTPVAFIAKCSTYFFKFLHQIRTPSQWIVLCSGKSKWNILDQDISFCL